MTKGLGIDYVGGVNLVVGLEEWGRIRLDPFANKHMKPNYK